MKRIPDAPWIKEAIREGRFPDDLGGGRAKARLVEAEAVAMSAIFDALMEPPYDPDEVRREFRVRGNSGFEGFSD